MTASSPWLPIESAPKDSTLVDLWADGRRLPDCWFGHLWDEDETEDLHWYQQYAENPGSYFFVSETPTHWMPIPSGPD